MTPEMYIAPIPRMNMGERDEMEDEGGRPLAQTPENILEACGFLKYNSRSTAHSIIMQLIPTTYASPVGALAVKFGVKSQTCKKTPIGRAALSNNFSLLNTLSALLGGGRGGLIATCIEIAARTRRTTFTNDIVSGEWVTTRVLMENDFVGKPTSHYAQATICPRGWESGTGAMYRLFNSEHLAVNVKPWLSSVAQFSRVDVG